MTTINTELYGVLNAIRVATKFGKPITDLMPRIDEVLKKAEAADDLLPDLLKASSIAATTLETVYRERDPKNIAAKCAAERVRNVLAKLETLAA